MYGSLRRFLHLSMTFCLLAMLSACSQVANNKTATHSSTPPSTPASTEAAQTCPAPASARAGIMTPMPTIGMLPNFVYLFYPHDGTATVRRYDMTTASTTTLLQYIQGRVKANVSPDGQWLLLTTEVQGRSALQILRLDGQQLQTLYCTPLEGRIDSVLFSPDQRSLLFSEEVGNNSPLTGSLSLLDVETGKVRTEASWSYTVGVLPYPGLSPLKWANESSVYLAGSHLPAHLLDRPPNLYLLRNISKDVSQQKSNIQLIHAPTAEHDCVVVDVTPDNGQLVGMCSASPSRKRHEEAATIELRPLTGKTFHTIYRDPGGIVDVRVLSNSTVLFIQVIPTVRIRSGR